MDLHSERGAADNAWIIQLVVVLALFGLIGVEVFKMASAGLGADNAASAIVDEVESVYESTGRVDRTRTAAEAAALDQGVELLDVTVEGNVLEVTVRRDANTLFLHRILGEDASWIRPAATRSTGVRG